MPTPRDETIGQKTKLDEKTGLPLFVLNADTGEKIIDPKKMAKQGAKREEALTKHSTAQLALIAWRQQHPNAPEADALKWVDSYLADDKKLKAGRGPAPINPSLAP